MSEGRYLAIREKEAPAVGQGYRGRERLIKRPWLQLMSCALVSSHEIGCVFRSGGSRQNRGPRESSERVQMNKMGLGPDDVNLQTEELHCNYSVLIVCV